MPRPDAARIQGENHDLPDPFSPRLESTPGRRLAGRALREMRGTDADPNAVAVSSLLLLALLFVFSVLVIRRSRGGIAGIIPTLEKD